MNIDIREMEFSVGVSMPKRWKFFPTFARFSEDIKKAILNLVEKKCRGMLTNLICTISGIIEDQLKEPAPLTQVDLEAFMVEKLNKYSEDPRAIPISISRWFHRDLDELRQSIRRKNDAIGRSRNLDDRTTRLMARLNEAETREDSAVTEESEKKYDSVGRPLKPREFIDKERLNQLINSMCQIPEGSILEMMNSSYIGRVNKPIHYVYKNVLDKIGVVSKPVKTIVRYFDQGHQNKELSDQQVEKLIGHLRHRLTEKAKDIGLIKEGEPVFFDKYGRQMVSIKTNGIVEVRDPRRSSGLSQVNPIAKIDFINRLKRELQEIAA